MRRASDQKSEKSRSEIMDELLWHFGNSNITKSEFFDGLKAHGFTLDDIDLFLTGDLK